MRFRPLEAREDRGAGIALDLAPRSLYVMRDEIRWDWQHHIPPTKMLRYSITLRTRGDAPAAPPARRPRPSAR
jgi:alkylated DNA repair dioxygenase AlkB